MLMRMYTRTILWKMLQEKREDLEHKERYFCQLTSLQIGKASSVQITPIPKSFAGQLKTLSLSLVKNLRTVTAPAHVASVFWHHQTKHLRYLAVHEIGRKKGEEKAETIPLIHSIICCADTVSFLGGKGEKTAWDVWNVFPELAAIVISQRRSMMPFWLLLKVSFCYSATEQVHWQNSIKQQEIFSQIRLGVLKTSYQLRKGLQIGSSLILKSTCYSIALCTQMGK